MQRSVSIDVDDGIYGTMVDTTSHLIYKDVHCERVRAHLKHDTNKRSMERAVYNDPRWLPVLTEELGEVAKVICDSTKNGTPVPNIDATHLREELIQLAAMACAWVQAIDAHPSALAAINPGTHNPL